MFIRTKVFKNRDGTTRTYLQIVESRRVGGKMTQKVIANLGRMEDLQSGSLDRLIESMAKFSKKQWVEARAKSLGANWSKEWGPALIFRHLWNELGLGRSLKKLLASTHVQSDFQEAIFAMVLNRLTDPQSKRGVSEWAATVYQPEFEQLELHHYYRALDFLAENKEVIENRLFDRVRDLFNVQLDLVFWDTTSTYFDGRGPLDLAQFGFSKDHRPDRYQILIGVLMTKDGMPVAHEVFPGNTAEVDTFRKTLEELKTRFQIRRVILVGDRGMVSDEILQEIERAGYEYIVGVRMRRLKAAREVLGRAGRYHVIKENLRVKEVAHNGMRYIVCHNPEEARHDREAREAMVSKLEEKLKAGGTKSLIGNKGYRRYLSFDGKKPRIDQKAIKQESLYDGKYVLRTNTALSPDEVALAYKGLWQVERAFRELKSGLDLRPIYHWTESRVRGHVMVCFLALVLETALKRRLNAVGSDASYPDLLRDLSQLKAVEIELDGDRYLARTELHGKAYDAFRALGIRPPLRVELMPPP